MTAAEDPFAQAEASSENPFAQAEGAAAADAIGRMRQEITLSDRLGAGTAKRRLTTAASPSAQQSAGNYQLSRGGYWRVGDSPRSYPRPPRSS